MLLDKPLTNVQLELMKMFSHDLSESDLLALRRVLAKFFADQASGEMDRLWQERNWSDRTMEDWLVDRSGSEEA